MVAFSIGYLARGYTNAETGTGLRTIGTRSEISGTTCAVTGSRRRFWCIRGQFAHAEAVCFEPKGECWKFDIVARSVQVMLGRDSPPQVWRPPIIVVSDVFSIVNFWVGYHSPIFVMMISVTWPFVLVGLERGLTIKLADDGVSQITLNGHQRDISPMPR